jgi:hypothetical protein
MRELLNFIGGELWKGFQLILVAASVAAAFVIYTKFWG